MPKEGFKAITVSEEIWNELKERAEKDGLSLPQLIYHYITRAERMDALSWVENPQAVQNRIQQIATDLYSPVLSRRFKEWAKEFRLKGESVPSELSYDLRIQWEKEVKEESEEFAKLVVEKDKETYEELKKLDEKSKIIYRLRQASDQVKEIKKDSLGMLFSVTYKTNAEVIKGQLLGIHDKLKAVFGEQSSLDELRTHLLEINPLISEWNNLRKYVPFLDVESQDLDQKIANVLGMT